MRPVPSSLSKRLVSPGPPFSMKTQHTRWHCTSTWGWAAPFQLSAGGQGGHTGGLEGMGGRLLAVELGDPPLEGEDALVGLRGLMGAPPGALDPHPEVEAVRGPKELPQGAPRQEPRLLRPRRLEPPPVREGDAVDALVMELLLPAAVLHRLDHIPL